LQDGAAACPEAGLRRGWQLAIALCQDFLPRLIARLPGIETTLQNGSVLHRVSMQHRSLHRCLFIVLTFGLWIAVAHAQDAARYPADGWEQIEPSQSGWPAARLEQAKLWSQGIGTTALVIIQHGAIVASWGDTSANILLYSARKSFLSALVGIAVAHHQIDLDETIGKLGIDDNPPSLTADEKQATVHELLEARSRSRRRPERGSEQSGRTQT
jgi:CubicO group peptidase (beta-lactamase class C family)